jgi:hypothetical protein
MTWSSPPKFKFALKISVKKVEEEVFKEPFAQPGQHEEALRILKENKEHAADCNMLGDCGVAALLRDAKRAGITGPFFGTGNYQSQADLNKLRQCVCDYIEEVHMHGSEQWIQMFEKHAKAGPFGGEDISTCVRRLRTPGEPVDNFFILGFVHLCKCVVEVLAVDKMHEPPVVFEPYFNNMDAQQLIEVHRKKICILHTCASENHVGNLNHFMLIMSETASATPTSHFTHSVLLGAASGEPDQVKHACVFLIVFFTVSGGRDQCLFSVPSSEHTHAYTYTLHTYTDQILPAR